jgi:plasmid maintenance system antidote protein VapI
MRISVQVHGNLRHTSSVGQEQKELFAQPGCSVKDLLQELNIWESEVRRVLRNGEEIRMNTAIRARDKLELFS